VPMRVAQASVKSPPCSPPARCRVSSMKQPVSYVFLTSPARSMSGRREPPADAKVSRHRHSGTGRRRPRRYTSLVLCWRQLERGTPMTASMSASAVECWRFISIAGWRSRRRLLHAFGPIGPIRCSAPRLPGRFHMTSCRSSKEESPASASLERRGRWSSDQRIWGPRSSCQGQADPDRNLYLATVAREFGYEPVGRVSCQTMRCSTGAPFGDPKRRWSHAGCDPDRRQIARTDSRPGQTAADDFRSGGIRAGRARPQPGRG